MILNVSGRTDIVAFYTPWFLKRLEEGTFDVRNPFNPKMVSRISMENVDAFLFCTKNPHPILPYLNKIKKPILFQVTLTGYQKDIEPFVPDKKQIIEDILELSNLLGKENVSVRYDPIFLSSKYTIDYHIKAFEKLCERLDGKIEKFIISFLDDYKNVRNHIQELGVIPFQEEDYQKLGENFSRLGHLHNIQVHTCFEERNLTEYGLDLGECISQELGYMLTGKKLPSWKARKGDNCQCVQMVDIGVYNTCPHKCLYCYANYDEKQIIENKKKHNPNSSLLIGHLKKEDIIKERRK